MEVDRSGDCLNQKLLLGHTDTYKAGYHPSPIEQWQSTVSHSMVCVLLTCDICCITPFF